MKNKKGKGKSKQKDIELNKSSRIVLFIVSIIVVLLLSIVLLTYISSSFSNIFWFNIKNPINGYLFNIFQHFPFITDNLLIIFISMIIISAICVMVLNYPKVPKDKKSIISILANLFDKILALIILLAFISISLTLSDFNHQNIDKFYLNDYIEHKYTEDDVFNLLQELTDIVITESKELNRLDGEVLAKKEILERISRNDLLSISNRYQFLRGAYPDNIKTIKNKMNVYGYTKNYSISTDKSINNINYLSVITHEYCHYKGILHESDAVYCAYLAGINSKEKISNYSAHMEAFAWVMNVAEKIDEDKTNKIVEEMLNLCLNDNYREVCDLQIKNINKYQSKSNIIRLSSYLLDGYHDLVNDFINILDEYQKRYDATFLIDGKEVTLVDIRNSIICDEDKILHVIIKNDEKTFEDIKNYLSETSRYFKSIRQQNNRYEQEKENIDYYLLPFSNEFLSIFNGAYNDYAYPRVVRLLLEHRSVYGIK